MRPITKLTMCAIAAAAMTAPTTAIAANFLKIGDVKSKAAAGGGTRLEILSWSWGATQAGSWNGTIKGATDAGKFGTVGGMHRDESATSPRDPASTMPTEKRQHGWVTVSKPVDQGSVRVKVKLPWLDCKVGAAFPDAVLQNDAGRYELQNILISSCAPDSVGLDYAKVTVRGWDPTTR